MLDKTQYDLVYGSGYWSLSVNATVVATADGYLSADQAKRWALSLMPTDCHDIDSARHSFLVEIYDDSYPTCAPGAASHRQVPDGWQPNTASAGTSRAAVTLVVLFIVAVVVLVWLR
jgi:hypothetical protein